MKIRILVAGKPGAVLCGRPWPAVGDVIDLPTAAAAHLVASEVAKTVTDTPPRGRRKSRKESDGG